MELNKFMTKEPCKLSKCKIKDGLCAQSWLTLCNPMDCNLRCSSVHGIFQAKYWSGLPVRIQGDLPDPGIESASLRSPELAGGFFTTSNMWEAQMYLFLWHPLFFNRQPPTVHYFSLLWISAVKNMILSYHVSFLTLFWRNSCICYHLCELLEITEWS